jgi:hypothetical protein
VCLGIGEKTRNKSNEERTEIMAGRKRRKSIVRTAWDTFLIIMALLVVSAFFGCSEVHAETLEDLLDNGNSVDLSTARWTVDGKASKMVTYRKIDWTGLRDGKNLGDDKIPLVWSSDMAFSTIGEDSDGDGYSDFPSIVPYWSPSYRGPCDPLASRGTKTPYSVLWIGNTSEFKALLRQMATFSFARYFLGSCVAGETKICALETIPSNISSIEPLGEVAVNSVNMVVDGTVKPVHISDVELAGR